MDKATFDNYYEKDLGTPSKINTKLNLTTEEEELYQHIKENNYKEIKENKKEFANLFNDNKPKRLIKRKSK